MFLKNKINKIIILLGSVLALALIFVFFPKQHMETAQEKQYIILGGGHVGLIEAYSAYLRAQKSGEKIRITIFEKNAKAGDTTAANIWNSHTPDEIVAVVPRGAELEAKLLIPFHQPGGIRVDDVPDINDTDSTRYFVEQVKAYGKDEEGHKKRTNALLKLGKAAMALWKERYETADPELKKIMQESNFNPCTEVASTEKMALHKGYRIDLIYDVPNAKDRAEGMMKSYHELGYKSCRLLSPDEVEAIDPSLAQFCATHSVGDQGNRQWKEDSVALWRPGGCLDTQMFLPKFVNYLKTAMGTYVAKDGKTKDRFEIVFGKKVTGLSYENQGADQVNIKGLKFEDGTQTQEDSSLKYTYLFCPGEAVGTLTKLGFSEPAFAGFAGASLYLNIPVSEEQLKAYQDFSHYMEVHKVGVIIAWQARIRDGKIFLGGAGTKSYYGNKKPSVDDAFAKDRNLLQLRMFNEVLPHIVSLALNRDTKGQQLTAEDLALLEEKGIAKRWAGTRAVTYDGFPIVGRLYHEGKMVANARATTYLSSGGGSFSNVMSLISHSSMHPEEAQADLQKLGLDPAFIQEVLGYADSRRSAGGGSQVS